MLVGDDVLHQILDGSMSGSAYDLVRPTSKSTNHWLIASNPNHVERLNVTRMVARSRRCDVQIPDALGVVNLGDPSHCFVRVSQIREQLQCESSFA